MPWLLVAGDDLFQVAPEVFVQCDGRVAPLRLFEDFGDGPSTAIGRTDHGNGPVVFLFDNHFTALLDFRHTARTSRASSASVIRTVILTSMIAASGSRPRGRHSSFRPS